MPLDTLSTARRSTHGTYIKELHSIDSQPRLKVYSDALWVDSKLHAKFTTGVLLTMNGTSISKIFKQQPVVALSTMEAEFIANATGVSECLWVKDLLSELRPTPNCEPLSLNIDNEAAIMNMENSVSSPRSKHINIRFHFVRDNVQTKRVTVHYYST